MLPCTLGALLATLVAVAGAPEAPPPCEVEMNKIKDLLQVSCVGRGLSGVPPGLPPDTGILLLASNRLRRVSLASFAPLRDLVELDLSNNSLAALDPPAPGAPGLPPGLQQLDLSHNGLQSLPPLQGAPALRRLALAHNALSRLPAGGFRALRALEDLELQGNGIRDVAPGAFEGLAKLRDVDLADNLLEELPQELLAGLGKLEILRLERNRLARLPDGFFPEENFFAYLYLAGNPWVCDCALVYLRDYIQTYETSVYTRVQGPGKEITENKPESVVCEAPEDQKGRPVIHFHAECGGPEGDSDGGIPGESPGDATEPPHAHATLVSTAVVPARSVPTTRSTAPPSTRVPTTRSTVLLTTRVHRKLSMAPPTTCVPTTRSTVPPTTRVPTTRSTAPTTTRVPTTRSTVPPTTRVPTTPSIAAPTMRVHRKPSTAPPTTHDPMTLSTAPPTTHAPTTLSTAPPTTRVHRKPSTAPLTTHVPTTPSTAPLTTHVPTTLSMAPPTTRVPMTPSMAPPTMRVHRKPSTAGPAMSVPTTPSTSAAPHPLPSTPASFSPSAPDPRGCPPSAAPCPCSLPAPVAQRRGLPSARSWGVWLAARCCQLRLILYLACLALAALPSLALLSWLLCGSWQRPPLRGRPGPPLQKGAPRGWQPEEPQAPRPLAVPPTYRTCQVVFQAAPPRHISWLFVSLRGPTGKWPWHRTPSSYSLDRGQDALGAVRVKPGSGTL